MKNIREKCGFCKYDNEIEITQSKYSACTFFLKSIKPGHVTLFPKRHVEKYIELEHHEICDLFQLVHKISSVIHSLFEVEKLYMLSIGDKSNHFHIHLIPRLTQEKKMGPYIFGELGWKTNFTVEDLPNYHIKLRKKILKVLKTI